MSFQRVVIEGVPDNALVAFRRAAEVNNASRTDVINWTIQILAKPGTVLRSLYWVENFGRQNEKVTKIDLTPIPPRDPVQLTINLLDTAVDALAKARRYYRCDEAGVLARAAWLAIYFGRRDGRLATGRVASGKFTLLRFVT